MKDGGAPGRRGRGRMLANDTIPYALTLLKWALTDKSDRAELCGGHCQALGVRGNRQTIPKLVHLSRTIAT